MPRESEINFRKGTALQWATSNPTLELGEPGFETDTLKFKVGDGSTAWNLLKYVGLDGGVVGSGGSESSSSSSPANSSSSSNLDQPPAQIADFSATASNQPDNGVADRIEFTWTAPSDNGYAITGYSLEFTVNNIDWYAINQTIEPGMTWTNGSPGTTFYFRIRASNSGGNAEWSATASAVFPKPGCKDFVASNYDATATYDNGSCSYAPAQITDLSATSSPVTSNGTADRISLSWSQPYSPNNASIGNYQLQYSTDNANWSSMDATEQTSTTWASGTPGQTYYFRVQAGNGSGYGAWSASSSAVFPKPGCVNNTSASNYDATATYDDGSCLYVPNQITDLSAAPSNQPDNGSSDRIVLTWTTPYNNGSSITSMSAEYSTDNITWGLVSAAAESGLTWASGEAGTTYYFRVRASNLNGDGAWSTAASAVFPKPGCTSSGAANYDSTATYNNGTCTPDQISDLSATPSNEPDNGFSDRIILTWTSPSDNGSAITAYSMDYSTDNTSWSSFGGVVESGMIFSAFSAGQTYYFRVRASNLNGAAEWSNSPSAVFPKPGCTSSAAGNYDSTATYNNGTCSPDQITDLIATPSNLPDNSVADGIVLTWTNPSDNGSAITGYSFQYSTDGGENWTVPTFGGTVESGLLFSGYDAGQTFHFRVRASSANGDAAWSTAASAVFPKPGCTDPEASNYDATATYDNGTCMN